MIKISIPLAPEGKKAPHGRIVRTKSGKQFISFYTTSQTRKYEAAVKNYALAAMGYRPPFEGAVTVTMDAVYAVPESWSHTKWNKAVSGVIRPTGKPDADNVSKMIGDAFNKVVWLDDAQVVDLRVRKFYGRVPSITVTVRETAIGLLERDEEAA